MTSSRANGGGGTRPAYELSLPMTLAECHELDGEASAAGSVAYTVEGAPVFLRYDGVARLLAHRGAVTGFLGMLEEFYPDGLIRQWLDHFIHNPDEAIHSRLRSLVWRSFAVRPMERMRPIARKIAEEELDALSPGDVFDAFDAFSARVPLRVLGALMGIQDENTDELRSWIRDFWPVFLVTEPSAEVRARAERATEKLFEITDRLISERLENPGADLISELAQAERSGALTRFELQVMLSGLLFAGTDTTKSLIGLGLYLLSEHPDELEKLHHDPELAVPAVEEILRVSSPVPWVPRVATERIVCDEATLEPGTFFLLSLSAANLDPAAYSFPRRFDLSRKESPHLAFGRGHYFCLGAALARVEGQEMFRALAARGIRLGRLGDPPRWRRSTGFMEPSEAVRFEVLA